MSISKHEDSDGTGYCRGCGTTIGEEHLPECDLVAVDSARLLERLAALEHEQWWRWAEHLMQTEPNLSVGRIARWKGSMVPYHELTEENKEYDRIWARRVLDIVSPNKAR